MLSTEDYKTQILDEMVRKFEANHNSLSDAYALIWAIDVYASLVWFQTGKRGKEPDFKDAIEEQCEAFGIIRSASNAIKHIERDKKIHVVISMGDIQPQSGPSWHSFFANRGMSQGGVKITMSWEYDSDSDEFKRGDGKPMVAPQNEWKTQYLRNLYRPAIEAIEARLTELQ